MSGNLYPLTQVPHVFKMHWVDIGADERIMAPPTESIHLKGIRYFFGHIKFCTSIAVFFIVDVYSYSERMRGEFTPWGTGIILAACAGIHITAENIGTDILYLICLAGELIG